MQMRSLLAGVSWIGSGWGQVARGTNHVSTDLELSAPPPPLGRGEGPKVELITNVQ